MHGLLAEYDAASSVSKMPIEDRQAAFESVWLATRIHDELQRNVVFMAGWILTGILAPNSASKGESSEPFDDVVALMRQMGVGGSCGVLATTACSPWRG